MTTPVPPVLGYATVEDYALRTGTPVPDEQAPTVQQRLNDTSALIRLYLGDCAMAVESAYPDVLTALTCTAAQRSFAGMPGIRSESVGSTSVSYLDTSSSGLVAQAEAEVLDALMGACCDNYNAGSSSSVGQIGVAWDSPSTGWPAGVDVWVMP